MKYIIGLDGGATKTIGYIADISGNILAFAKDKGTNYHSLGVENTQKVIDTILKSLCDKISTDINHIDLISFGLAGVYRDNDKKIIENMIINLGYKCPIVINSDAVTALVGAVGETKGIITISGTGSICYGVDVYGNIKRAGGWGHIIGDEGSGYFIGKTALSSIMKSIDGTGYDTILKERVLNFLDLKSTDEIISYVYDSKTTKDSIAKIAPIVINAAYENDVVALNIVEDTVNSLLNITEAVIKQLKFEDNVIKLALSGGILSNDNLIRCKFQENIMKKYNNLQIVDPLFDGGIGALIIGWDKLNVIYDKNILKMQMKEEWLHG